MANILDVIGDFHRFSKLCGFTVFTINPKNLKIEFTCSDLFINLCSISINVWFHSNYFYYFSKVKSHGSEIINSTYPILMCISFSIVFFNLISQFFLRFKIVEVIRKFIEVDLEINRRN